MNPSTRLRMSSFWRRMSSVLGTISEVWRRVLKFVRRNNGAETSSRVEAELQDAEEGNIHHDGSGSGSIDAGDSMAADSHGSEETKMHHDGSGFGDSGDAGQGVVADLGNAEEGNIRHAGGGNGGDAGLAAAGASSNEDEAKDNNNVSAVANDENKNDESNDHAYAHANVRAAHNNNDNNSDGANAHAQANAAANNAASNNNNNNNAANNNAANNNADDALSRGRRKLACAALLDVLRLILLYCLKKLFFGGDSFSLSQLVFLCLGAMFILVTVVAECMIAFGLVGEAQANGMLQRTRRTMALVRPFVYVVASLC